MRKLSDKFMQDLQTGFLAGITRQVIEDKDLDLHIREDYINIYFKGNSLLKLTEKGSGAYRVEIHEKFIAGVAIPDLVDGATTAFFLSRIPYLKENIIRHGKHSLETEYEQLLVRANNLEPGNNTDYFIVDRQYTVNRERFDLMGIYWRREGRKRGDEVPLCLMEVKFALQGGIGEVHNQLERYYQAVKPRAEAIAEECEVVFRQRLELGLYDQSKDRIEAMKTLTISRNLKQFQFILILVDYNPHSSLFDPASLSRLSFADQIKIFYSGFAMWERNLENPA